MPSTRALAFAAFLTSAAALLLELALTRVFGLVLFASFTHLALAVGMMGIAVGAVAQHVVPRLVPADRLAERLGHLAVAQAAASILAVTVVVALPLTDRSEAPVTEFVLSRLRHVWELINPFAFAAMLPFLVLPFAAVGWFFAALFEHRRDRIGLLYGADLAGAAVGAVVLVPLLHALAAPDVVFVSAAAALLAATALYGSAGHATARLAAAAATAGCVVVSLVAVGGPNLLHARYPAGFTDDFVVAERWTAMARIALHEGPDETRILLDNSSSSAVVRTRSEAVRLAADLGRSLVFRLHQPPARVAVLAASAGPDVAVAQHLGYTGIHAIDVTPEIGDLVLLSYPTAPVNPFRDGGTRRIVLDARAAVLHAQQPYDILQMIHANLHGAAGLMAQSWSPGLLGTVEAFETWLDHLTPDGTVSFSRGSRTRYMVRSAAEALRRGGVVEPWRHLVYVNGPNSVVLVKPRPFTQAERDRVVAILKDFPRWTLVIDPMVDAPTAEVAALLDGGAAMTDDRPFPDTAADVWAAWGAAGGALATADADDVRTEAVVYYLMLVEAAAVAVAALLLFWLPWRYDRRHAAPAPRTWAVLGYAACLGYGYLAVEVALIQRHVLLVGHPVLAMSAVVASMLVSSGLGSLWIGRFPTTRLPLARDTALAASLALVALTAASAAPLLTLGLGLPLEARTALCAASVAIPALPMGMALPGALAALPGTHGRLVPWAWATNGLFSVVSALGTALVAHLAGYTAALALGAAAYALALAFARLLPRDPR